MSFREQLDDDLDIFFDSNEFAQGIIYSGVSIQAIVDFNLDLNYSGSDVYEYAQITLRTKDISNKPKFGDAVSIDAQVYIVENIVESDENIQIVNCRRNESVRFRG